MAAPKKKTSGATDKGGREFRGKKEKGAASAKTISLYPSQTERLKARAGQDLESRSGLSCQIQQDLEFLWGILDLGLAECRRVLSPDEARLVTDVQNGTSIFMMAGESIREVIRSWCRPGLGMNQDGTFSPIPTGLYHNVRDGIDLDRLDEKWGVDGPALLKKLEMLSPFGTAALFDFCAVLWRNTSMDWEPEFAKFQGGTTDANR